MTWNLAVTNIVLERERGKKRRNSCNTGHLYLLPAQEPRRTWLTSWSERDAQETLSLITTSS